MKRSQVTARISHWEGKGALYIVAHARYQSYRGKNPSEPYKGEFNPRKALKLALAELRIYKGMLGGYIPALIADMVGVAKLTNQEVTGEFNGVSVTATPNSSPETLVDWWVKEMDRRSEEYRNSDECKQREREYHEREERRRVMLQKELAESPATITFKDEEGWKRLIELNKGHIGVMNYAERWARLMEGWLAKGGTLDEYAEEASHLADDEGMSGASYGYAVRVLVQCWIHGEQLCRLHNSKYQFGNEGDKANESDEVLDPAVLCIDIG